MSQYQYWHSTPFFGNRPTAAVRFLLILCGLAFLFQQLDFFSGTGQLTGLLGLRPFFVWHQLQLWRLGTYLFLHGDFFHILFNLLTLYFFGPEMERLWGTARFYRYFFITGVGAGLFVTFSEPYSAAVTIGSSGAIYGLLVAFALNFPNRLVYLYALFPVKVKHMVIGIFVLAFFASVGGSGGRIAHWAHLGGAVIGFVYLRAWNFSMRLRNYLQQRRQEESRRKFRVYYQERKRSDHPKDPDSRIIH